MIYVPSVSEYVFCGQRQDRVSDAEGSGRFATAGFSRSLTPLQSLNGATDQHDEHNECRQHAKRFQSFIHFTFTFLTNWTK
jgi:hypothetical protein